MFRSLIVVVCLTAAYNAAAQRRALVTKWSADPGKPLIEFLTAAEKEDSIKFFYLEEWLKPFVLNREWRNAALEDVLNYTLQDSDIGFVSLYDYSVIFYKDPKRELERNAIRESAIERRIRVDEVAIGTLQDYVPGTNVILVGTMTDKEARTPLAGATVYVNGLDQSTQTDAKGQFRLSLPGGEYIINFRHVNYEERLLSLMIYSDGLVNITMEETPTTLGEVVVYGQQITTKPVGLTTMSMNELARAPAFLGEPDVIRVLQTQAGVSTVSDASTGYHVRGGAADQNLVLYDGVPIFNTAHAFGFFTSFNSDAIREASFYKGGIPAEYGSRVSSVLNMSSREGDFRKWHGSVGISFVSANASVGGPIKRDTSSLMVSLRSTYSDWILNLLQTNYQDIQESSVFFYDGSVKYSHRLSNGANLQVSSYFSKDKFRLANDTLNTWQNLAFAVRYDHRYKQDLYYSVGLYLGNYAYTVREDDPPTAFDLSYNILYPSLKIDFNRDRVHKQAFGFHSTFYNFKPGTLKATSAESNVADVTMPSENSIELAVYFSESFFVTEKLSIEAGLRLSMFSRIGPGWVYSYQPGSPLEPRNVVDSTYYSSGQPMKTYGGPEPRLSIQYKLNTQSSVKLGYNRIYQYIHLVSNTAAITPVDVWQSSDNYFRPQIGDQLSLGYFKVFRDNVIQTSVEMYGKHVENILDFKDGANLILNPKLETSLLPGTGLSYGVEFTVEKTRGKLVGGINYTYSRSLRKVDGEFESEKVNNGEYYPANYDQPNIVNVNWRQTLRRNIYFSGVFTYRTGRPVSVPLAAYEVNEAPVIDFSDRNNYRLPPYHRLDLALIIEGNIKKKKGLSSEWTFSIYNVYGRKNPYSVFYVYNVTGAVKPYQLSLIAAPIPSISYTLNF